MVEIDRRTAVLIAGVGLTGSPLRAQPLSSSFADDPEVSPDALSPELSFQPRNSVEFWNSVALELVAIDHTVDPKQARAIGPVATARALGLIHIVIADAVALAYPQPLYSPFLSRDDKPVAPSSPALFVGGAAAAIMEHIYANQAHTSFVNAKRREFLNAYGRRHLASWKAGLIFGRKDVYRSKYVFSEVDRLINPKTSTYVPGPQQHREDPLAPGQGYYGHSWGVKPDPFAISAEHVTKKITENGCAPVAPPAVGSAPYQRSADDVRAKGELKGDSDKPETITRTAQQSYPGLFWAYDGAAFIGTPLRLYNQILIAIARKDRLGPRRLARMLALCNIAMSDAGNVAWYAKYFHKYPRPVIGLNPNLPSSPTKADIKWIPLGSPKTNRLDFASGRDAQPFTALVGSAERVATVQTLLGASLDPAQSPIPSYAAAAFTPNFPSYPSGHATFGAACFETLRKVREADRLVSNADKTNLEDFVSDELDGESVDNFLPRERPTRSHDLLNIDQVISDNGDSRVFLGVHWDFDASGGIASGQEVAKAVAARDPYPK